MDQSTRTHRAGFNCNKEFAVSKAVVTNGFTSLAKSCDFSMCGGIGVDDVAIPPTTNDLSISNYDCADRNLAELESALSAAERFLHPEFIRGGGLIRALMIDLLGRVVCRSWSSAAQDSSTEHSTDSGSQIRVAG